MNRGWYTKEDVMKDLAFANGTNLDDDSYLISGSCPPPPPRQYEDEEYEERFGRYGGVIHENLKPDLKGIAAMVRLVNEDESPRKENRPKRPEVNSGIVISKSKLNPHVPEFKPKQALNSNNNNSSSFATNGRIEDSSKVLKEETVIKNEADTNDSIQIVTKHDTLEPCKNSDLNDDDAQQAKMELEAMLKGKILQAAKAKTIKEKSARNVALAALLKLKSGPPPSPKTPLTDYSSGSKSSSLDTIPPKQIIVLHPPTFYQQKCATPNPENEISMPQSSEPETSSEENNKPVDKEAVDKAKPSVTGVVELEDREKIESIKKVEDWLDNTKKPKSVKAPHPSSPITFKKRDPKPHLGPLVYTKKVRSIPSPASVSDDSKPSQATETKNKPSQPPAFVPSQYANELARKYEERAKVKENVQLDIWSKLERDLKAKDEAVRQRQRMREKEASSNASPSTSTGSSD